MSLKKVSQWMLKKMGVFLRKKSKIGDMTPAFRLPIYKTKMI